MHTTEEFETFRVTADLSKAVDLLIRFKVPFDIGSTVEDRKKFTQETMPIVLSHEWKHFTQTNDLPDGEFPCVVCDMGHCPYKMPPKYPHGLPIRAPYFMTLTKDQLTHLRVETGPGEPLLYVWPATIGVPLVANPGFEMLRFCGMIVDKDDARGVKYAKKCFGDKRQIF